MLVVPNRLIEQMNAHVEKAYPEEGAGFLIGEEGEIREIVALSNSREEEPATIAFCSPPRIICTPNLKRRVWG